MTVPARSDEPSVVDQRALRMLAEAVVDPDADLEEQTLAGLDVSWVRRHLWVLGMLERQVLCWRFGINGFERLSRPEIARRLAIPHWRVRTLEANALEVLRTEFLDISEWWSF